MTEAIDILHWSPAYTLLAFLLGVVCQLLQFATPAWILASRQPRRKRFGQRCALALCLLGASVLLVSLAGWSARAASDTGSMAPYVVNFLSYSLLLLALVPAILLCFDTGRWNALLYATSAYTIQNLGSGLGELVWILVEETTGRRLGLLSTSLVEDLAALLVTLACYVLFMRTMRDGSPLRRDSRGMLGMVGAVMVMVIANDVVIRGLDSQWGTRSIPLPFLVTFRLTHMAICAFVLYAEYEALFMVRLRSDMELQRRMSSERERQYELSHLQVRAINRRMHDIRHQVLRELSSGGDSLPRETMAEVARSIDLYDSVVHTGNAALDTVLSEKGLVCREEGITLTVVAEGPCLDFLPPSEAYALVDDVLSRGIRLTRGLPQAERRTISFNVHAVGSLVSMHMSCPQASTDQADSDALEVARSVARRHGGTLTTSSQGTTYLVDTVLSRP